MTSQNMPGHDTEMVVTLPGKVTTSNGLPVDVLVEDGQVVLRQAGRNTIAMDADHAEHLWQCVEAALTEARSEQPDATVFRLERRRQNR